MSQKALTCDDSVHSPSREDFHLQIISMFIIREYCGLANIYLTPEIFDICVLNPLHPVRKTEAKASDL